MIGSRDATGGFLVFTKDDAGMLNETITIERDLHLDQVGLGGRKELVSGQTPTLPVGRIPKVAR